MLERNISCVQTMEWFCFIEVSVDSQNLWYFFENFNIWKLILVVLSGGIVDITPFFCCWYSAAYFRIEIGLLCKVEWV